MHLYLSQDYPPRYLMAVLRLACLNMYIVYDCERGEHSHPSLYDYVYNMYRIKREPRMIKATPMVPMVRRFPSFTFFTMFVGLPSLSSSHSSPCSQDMSLGQDIASLFGSLPEHPEMVSFNCTLELIIINYKTWFPCNTPKNVLPIWGASFSGGQFF